MTSADWIVLSGSATFLMAFFWWFFWSKKGEEAEATVSEGVQEVEVTVKGGYSPDRILVHAGMPVRIIFKREESGECTDRVVIPDFRISKPLPAYASTPVEFTPREPGEYGFECGMGMVHGKVVVTDASAGTETSAPFQAR